MQQAQMICTPRNPSTRLACKVAGEPGDASDDHQRAGPPIVTGPKHGANQRERHAYDEIRQPPARRCKAHRSTFGEHTDDEDCGN
jgi:hypothetical protein